MIGIPRALNTRTDYELVKSGNMAGWKEAWSNLLEGRFVQHGDELVEDATAPIFRLGFSVAEVEEALGFDGATHREIEWRSSQPDRWTCASGNWEEIKGWPEARAKARLTEAKKTKSEEIQNHKRSIRDAGVLVSGVLFDTDGAAQTMYTQFMVGCMLDPTYTVPSWKASGDTFVVMTAALINKIKTAWEELCARVYKAQAQKLAEVNALETVDAVNAYDVAAGWD